MIQFRQGGDEPPRPGDLIVFGGAAGYGHVAIVAYADANSIEVVQQNKPPARERLVLRQSNGGYVVEARLPPLGWLRLSKEALNRL
jgi:surface antigen